MPLTEDQRQTLLKELDELESLVETRMGQARLAQYLPEELAEYGEIKAKETSPILESLAELMPFGRQVFGYGPRVPHPVTGAVEEDINEMMKIADWFIAFLNPVKAQTRLMDKLARETVETGIGKAPKSLVNMFKRGLVPPLDRENLFKRVFSEEIDIMYNELARSTGQRIGKRIVGDYPDWFRNRGWKKKSVLNALLRRDEGSPLFQELKEIAEGRAKQQVPDYTERVTDFIPRSLGAAEYLGEKYAGRGFSAKYGSSINLDYIDAPERAKKVMVALGKSLPRHERVSWEETARWATESGIDVKHVHRIWKRTGGLNSKQLNFMREMNVELSDQIGRYIEDLPVNPTTDQLVGLQEMLLKYKQMVFDLTSEAASEAGRTLNILKKTVSPGQRMAHLFAKAGDKDKVKELIRIWKELDMSHLTFSDQTRILNKALWAMEKLTVPQFAEKIWINSILSGPQTHAVNIVSNTLNTFLRIPEKGFAAGIDFLRAGIGKGERTRYFGEVWAEMFGLMGGLRQGTQRMLQMMSRGKWQFRSQYEMPLFANISKVEDVVRQRQWWELPTHALDLEDRAFKLVNYAMDLNASAYRTAVKEGLKGTARKNRILELLSNPTKEMITEAGEGALFRTFQNRIGKFGQKITGLRNTEVEMLGGAKPLIYILPFIRTPVNVAKYGVKHTPLNAIYTLAQRGRGAYTNAQMADELARSAIGSLIGMEIVHLAREGKVTGSGPTEKNERDALRRTGWQPYSIKIGDKWVQVSRIEPMGMIFALSADYVDNFEKMSPEERQELAGLIIKSVSRNILDKTYMRGLSDTVNALTDPDRYAERYYQRFAGSYIPNILAQAARAHDPTIRQAETIMESIKARIPGMSKQLQPKLNIWGEEIKRVGTEKRETVLGIPYDPYIFMSPFYLSQDSERKIDHEMMRLNLHIGMPSRKIGTLELKPEAYNRYVKMAGQPALEALEKIVTSDRYKTAPDVETPGQKYAKAMLIEDVIRMYREAARAQIIAESKEPEILQQIIPRKLQDYEVVPIEPKEDRRLEGFFK